MSARICQGCGSELTGNVRFCPKCGRAVEIQVCQACGAPLIEGACFCRMCGKEIAPRFCQNCGTQVPKDTRFCTNCGQEVISKPPPEKGARAPGVVAIKRDKLSRQHGLAAKLAKIGHQSLAAWRWDKMRWQHRLAFTLAVIVILGIVGLNLVGKRDGTISTPPSSFSISLETTSALPLTPLSISINGLSPEKSMTATFSNSSGYAITKKALRVTQDGTIRVGVPLYINPGTHKITEGKVNVIVSQQPADGSQGQQSKPVSFTIEDLPSLKGMPLGKATRSFFTASALLSQRYITALQFFENASDGKIDTSSARSQETDILKSIISGRNDIDSIIKDPTHVIVVGTAADGTPLQFTRDSLDIMDRVLAIWLCGLPLGKGPASPTTAEPVSSRPLGAGVVFSELAKPLLLSIIEGSVDQDKTDVDFLDSDLVDFFCGKIASIIGLTEAIEKVGNEPIGTTENTLAITSGLNDGYDLVGKESPLALGLFVPISGVLNAYDHAVNDVMGLAMDAVESNASPYNYSVPDDEAVRRSVAAKIWFAWADYAITVPPLISGGAPSGILSLAHTLAEKVFDGGSEKTKQNIIENLDSVRSGGGIMNGVIQESRNQSGLDMIVVDSLPYEGAPVTMTALTDAGGSYEFIVPTDTNGNLASSLTIEVSDP